MNNRVLETKGEISHLKSEMAGIHHKILSLLMSSVSRVTLSTTLKALADDLTAKGLAAEAAAVDQARLKLLEYCLARRALESKLEVLDEKKEQELLAAEKEKTDKLHARLLRITKHRDAIETDNAILREVNKNKQLEINLLMEEKNKSDPETMMAPTVHVSSEINKNLQCAETEARHLGRKITAGNKPLQRQSYPKTMMALYVSSQMEEDGETDEIKKNESLECALAKEVTNNKKGFFSWPLLLLVTTSFASILFASRSKAIK